MFLYLGHGFWSSSCNFSLLKNCFRVRGIELLNWLEASEHTTHGAPLPWHVPPMGLVN